MSRGQMFWGTALILFGGLMLAGEMGVSLPNGNSLLSLFWPVFLIGLGVWFLLSVFVRRNVEMEADSIDLQGAAEAKIRINHGAGEFRLRSGASGAELMRGNFAGGLDKKVDRSGDRLEVKMRPADNFIMFPPFGFKEQLDWDVSFNADVPMSLDMNLGANKSVIDLQDMKITDLKLKSGASDTVVTLPAHGRLNVNCEVGAASLVLIVPEGVAIRTHATVGAGEFRVDKTRFPNGESPDFTTAENAADIRVTGGAASIRVK